MPEDASKLSPAIPLKNTGLIKVGNTIKITNKILDEHSRRQLATNFKSVVIGNQEWMTENLSVKFFRNGDPIPVAKTNEEWTKAGRTGQPAWCYYDNKSANGKIYGKLYNWYAVNDGRGLAPKGWHIPNCDEWGILVDYLIASDFNFEGTSIGRKIAKSLASNAGWKEDFIKSGNVGNDLSKNNKTGFSALPGGSRNGNGTYQSAGSFGRWWSSEPFKRDYGDIYGYYFWKMDRYDDNRSWCRFMYYNDGNLGGIYGNKDSGLSVRCLKD